MSTKANTLSDIRKDADTNVYTGTDYTTPDGTFYATTKVLGILTTYLLSGEPEDENSTILGRVEFHGNIMNSRRVTYSGHNLKGGTLLMSSLSDEESFSQMIALSR